MKSKHERAQFILSFVEGLRTGFAVAKSTDER